MKDSFEVAFNLQAELKSARSELSALREENESLKSESFEELYNAVIDERDALREELVVVTVQRDVWKRITKKMFETKMTAYQRAEAADQRNAELETLLEKNENLMDALNCSGLMQFVRPELAASIRSCVREAQSRALRAALKPTESGASE